MSDLKSDHRKAAADRPSSTHTPPYRRKWKPAAPGSRVAAGQTLGDLFGARRAQRALAVLLPVSLAAHAVLVCVGASLAPASGGDIGVREDTYLAKVMQKEKAKQVSRKLSSKITMPPPPDNPEAFIAKTMQDSLSKDIANVIGNLLDVKVTGKITDKVAATLKDELEAAAAKINDQKLSQEEIDALQEDFRRKAHAAAQEALLEHRVETQVERAAMGTRQWYEEKVCRVLFTNLGYEMYGRPSWAPGPRLWYTTWPGGNDAPRWHELVSVDALAHRLEEMDRAYQGITGYTREENRSRPVIDQSWPGPNLEQTRFLKQSFHRLHERSMGGYKNQEVIPSWNDYIQPGTYGYGLVDEFYPHRRAEMEPRLAQLEQSWANTLELLDNYAAAAEEGQEPPRLKPLQEAFFASAKQTLAQCRQVMPDNAKVGACGVINHAILLETLREAAAQKQLHDRWVALMEETLWPLIHAYAEGQFKEGIIKQDGTIEQAMKAFADEIRPLMRRDLLRVLPFEKWTDIIFHPYRYRSKVTDDRCPPSDEDLKAAVEAMNEQLKRNPDLAGYAQQRRELLAQHYRAAVPNTVQVIRKHVFARGLLTKNVSQIAEGVDYSDKVQEKLDARKAAKDGRGQDLARIAPDGLPDISARLVALQYGLARGGLVEPVPCPESPGFAPTGSPPEAGLRNAAPVAPPLPAKWGAETQADVPRPYEDSPAFEAIPFLSRFPRLDGNLNDWGRIRPLVLHPADGSSEPMLLYAAWNYQGFFFGYKVRRPISDFYFPEQYRLQTPKRASWERSGGGSFTGIIRATREEGTEWMCKGDYVRLLFDTLDARSPSRGDPHTQEFIVLPRGSDTDPDLPGCERLIESRRDAQSKEWRGIVSSGKKFLRQPPPENGPDGTGPYRVAVFDDKGPKGQQSYTVEIFMPRSLFNQPVFCPGWTIGFDAAVATGQQGRFRGQHWSPQRDAAEERPSECGVCPRKWGDVLLLGTDPYIVLQNADAEGSVANSVIPGHSYLLTVIDPDRNVYASERDAVLLSVEVVGNEQDIEVFTVTETEKNSGIFRGYINTQPGVGRQVQGVVEALPGQELRLGYVDIGNSKGKRNVISELRLPVVAPLSVAGR